MTAALRLAVVSCAGADADPEDAPGRDVMEAAERRGWMVIAYHVCPGDRECVTASLMEMADVEEADLVLTVGGVGLAATDVVPESTLDVVERTLPGIPELMRARTLESDTATALDRSVAGQRERTLIVNLPAGSGPAVAALETAADRLELAVAAIRGLEA